MHIIECGLLLQTSGCSLVCMCACQLGTQVNPAQTHTRLNGPLCRTMCQSRYQKGKTNLDFTEARDSEWQWHQLGHMPVCTLLQTDNHASTSPLSFYRPDALPAAQPTASKHWRYKPCTNSWTNWDIASKQTHRGQSSQVLQWVQIGTIWQIVWNHLRGGSDAIITVGTCLTFIL